MDSIIATKWNYRHCTRVSMLPVLRIVRQSASHSSGRTFWTTSSALLTPSKRSSISPCWKTTKQGNLATANREPTCGHFSVSTENIFKSFPTISLIASSSFFISLHGPQFLVAKYTITGSWKESRTSSKFLNLTAALKVVAVPKCFETLWITLDFRKMDCRLLPVLTGSSNLLSILLWLWPYVACSFSKRKLSTSGGSNSNRKKGVAHSLGIILKVSADSLFP